MALPFISFIPHIRCEERSYGDVLCCLRIRIPYRWCRFHSNCSISMMVASRYEKFMCQVRKFISFIFFFVYEIRTEVTQITILFLGPYHSISIYIYVYDAFKHKSINGFICRFSFSCSHSFNEFAAEWFNNRAHT